ncbi:ATPase YjeE [Hyphomicrobium sulfonivorans]|uniref:tRNA threonylcarbamoyladenosine biosynthesis protein TsaE n=1 Tax=Hyphomicrobium sulfonivorans TaxID=121290 RepID=A0A109BKX7_HYPSL|nr:tRNA (adenosine(37)-N6)-threonylcarbamoyltransferase complex ATPase subunit type 1 TsaE [Hyphomicrobium sulfonivorans]KWT70644.1 ATPase YjeE [Hyphomicrobium sulfonivorans]
MLAPDVFTHVFPCLNEAQLANLGADLAFVARTGDLLTLSGELGAGKTTLARSIIHTLMDGAQEEIPSPTFTLVQTYTTPRMGVAHFDLYRLGAPEELDELGLDLALTEGIALVEWPERAESFLPHDRLEVRIDDPDEGTDTGRDDTAHDDVNGEYENASRRVTLTGFGAWASRLHRFIAMRALVYGNGGESDAAISPRQIRYLQGDASARRYGRIYAGTQCEAILMDAPRQPDGPVIRNGLPYSRIAHLAEDVRPFVAVADALRAVGATVPRIRAQDLANGFLIIDDLGDRVFGAEVLAGTADQATLWRAATDVLLALHAAPPPRTLPVAGDGEHELPRYDGTAMAIETELITDWFWPAVKGAPIDDAARAQFVALWRDVIAELEKIPPAWVLRDYHSPNLLWLPEREGVARVGLIDFQDAMCGPAAYDLVSLLQDARVDVPAELETELLDYYCNASAGREGFDRERFAFSYAALGAQRNTKIVGIFARLAKRDNKPGYLRHIPRLWQYLERDLAHPALEPLRHWYDAHFPAELRGAISG